MDSSAPLEYADDPLANVWPMPSTTPTIYTATTPTTETIASELPTCPPLDIPTQYPIDCIAPTTAQSLKTDPMTYFITHHGFLYLFVFAIICFVFYWTREKPKPVVRIVHQVRDPFPLDEFHIEQELHKQPYYTTKNL